MDDCLIFPQSFCFLELLDTIIVINTCFCSRIPRIPLASWPLVLLYRTQLHFLYALIIDSIESCYRYQNTHIGFSDTDIISIQLPSDSRPSRRLPFSRTKSSRSAPPRSSKRSSGSFARNWTARRRTRCSATSTASLRLVWTKALVDCGGWVPLIMPSLPYPGAWDVMQSWVGTGADRRCNQQCFKTDDQLIVAYSMTPAFGW